MWYQFLLVSDTKMSYDLYYATQQPSLPLPSPCYFTEHSYLPVAAPPLSHHFPEYQQRSRVITTQKPTSPDAISTALEDALTSFSNPSASSTAEDIQILRPDVNGAKYERIIYDQNVFIQKTALKNGNIRFRCNRYKKTSGNCPATITVNSSKTNILKQSQKPHNHPSNSRKSVDDLIATNRLVLDDSDSTFKELVNKHSVTASRKLRVQRLRRVTKVRSDSV